jgi:hypothetical protein
MDLVIILIIVGAAMSLFSIVVVASYTILEDGNRKKEIRGHARRQIIKQMERENKLEGKNQEIVDLLKEYR